MGLSYNTYLNAKRIYGCKNCKTHLADHDDIVSRVGQYPLLMDTLLRLTCAPEFPRPAWQGVPLQFCGQYRYG